MTETTPAPGYVICEQEPCGERHEAEYSHHGLHGEGPIFAVTCPKDGLTDYFTEEGIMR